MTTYEKITNETGNDLIKRTNEDGSTNWIPIDLANSDYQAYLESLKK